MSGQSGITTYRLGAGPGGYVAAVRAASSARSSPSSSTVLAGSASTWGGIRQACCATPSWRTSSRGGQTRHPFRRRGAGRLRRRVLAQPDGGRRPGRGRCKSWCTSMMKKQDRRGETVGQLHDAHTWTSPSRRRRQTSPSTTDIIATAPPPAAAGHQSQRPGASCQDGADSQLRAAGQTSSSRGRAIGIEFAYVLSNYGVK